MREKEIFREVQRELELGIESERELGKRERERRDR